MFKPGIHRLDQLSLPNVTSWWGRRKFIAIDLYPALQEADVPDRDELLQHILLRFALANGTFKRTYSGRFFEFDREAVRITREAFPPPTPIRVHDMAVSDGRTSVDFFQALARVYGDALRYRASDLTPWVFALQRPGERTRVIVDDQDRVLQIVWPPCVFNVPRPEKRAFYPINHALRRRLARTRVPAILAAPDAQRRRIDLVHAACALLDRNDARFELVQHDITQPVAGTFSLVRAMNILNPDYFDAESMRAIVGRIHAAVEEGGVFVTGSNQGPDSPVLGSIFRKQDGRFREVYASASGSPQRDVISAA